MAVNAQFKDMTHHLSPETIRRKPNPLKDTIRLILENPHLISLANGDPHPSTYPVRSMEFEVADPTGADPVATWRALGLSAPTLRVSADPASNAADAMLIRSSMRYGHGAGLKELCDAVGGINARYHTAPHHVPTISLASADGITKLWRMLGAVGDYFLADEYTFGPMALAADAHGVKWVPVRIDAGGLIPADLERLLRDWDDGLGRRPHVLYLTPCGQNPTGSTLSLERRKRIYEIAQVYDVIIVEDDPYYFLQYDLPNADPSAPEKPFPTSFLSLDVDGRVIRLDSFSKVMAPGLRVGWYTTSPFFHAHLVRLIDNSTQHPSGLPQVFLAQLLAPADASAGGAWGLDGFDRWVRSLRRDYQRRRDLLLRLFDAHVGASGLASADPPEAGMFVWIRVHIERHPRFARRAAAVGETEGPERERAVAHRPRTPLPQTNTAALMNEFFDACLRAGIVVCPGWAFVTNAEEDYGEPGAVPIIDRSNFVRTTFSGSEETMEAGVPILGRVLKEFFLA
ncbi:L-tyrosine:2-oxoglutarate aminotransferase [Epithele typhae]|uniref:L-tyrosine:2-oxoglutarate aminotransferase n=1 Tax=Epithele typhae TaxID=378194 RepID=UPI0020084A90|nr:L-tyrosine:2-oxoglutarate aminotransferase [Epithele typhae]KAH9915169.1 L-tyrosine:2-oxoglutarate aminotransferase [Epithele typhae]